MNKFIAKTHTDTQYNHFKIADSLLYFIKPIHTFYTDHFHDIIDFVFTLVSLKGKVYWVTLIDDMIVDRGKIKVAKVWIKRLS